LTLLAVFAFQACATKPEPVKFSGFLEHYSGFRPNSDESGAWSYRKPGLNLRGYNKIMLDQLVIWPSRNSSYEGIQPLTMWRLALGFQDQMSKALEGGYTIVTEPGPGVLRLRSALTKVQLQRPTVSTPGPIIPLANDIVIQASEKVSGLNAVDGEATIEAELLDSQTHERLAAYIGSRGSSRTLLTQDKDSLGPILEIFQFWARKLRQRLDEWRGLGSSQ